MSFIWTLKQKQVHVYYIAVVILAVCCYQLVKNF
jgi:hypothetical protein